MRKILFGLCLSIILSVAAYSFSIGGFIKDRVDDAVSETVQKQLLTVSKTAVNISSDKVVVEVTGIVKNVGPKASNVSVRVPCYDSKGAKVGEAFDLINSLKSKETWNFNASLSTSKGQKIEKCDLKQIKVDGIQ